ncbi:siderophore-interacting protein [Kineosporia babensis]|uniref:Siderophore-interacting protein n=1 Tax=Kineosporia babensis TaxID=499548 RepID=A0A9X1STG2_9ACTN|nr:siderophore-interacting protein [Kineosporia babensis]MCD5311844.1 siderophore-interacting protein [Kineosporia babensis]
MAKASSVRGRYPGLPESYEPRVHLAEVTQVRRVSEGMARVTLGGEDMHDYPTTGIGDEYVRLFFPDEPDAGVRLPYVTAQGWEYAEGVEPSQMRTYTIREHRSGFVDVDFVLHEGGVAAAWALQARAGQRIGLNPPSALYARPEWARRQILVADEPALPAALRIAELTAGQVPTTLIAEVRGPAYQLEAAGVDIRYVWLRGTGNGHAPSELLPALLRSGVDEQTYVWVASETRLSRHARKYLRHERALPAEAYKSIGYWTDKSEEWSARYDALGDEFKVKVRKLYDSDRDTEDIVDEVARLYEAAGL